MTASDESLEYTLNPFYNPKYREKSNYTIFYATLFICFLFAVFLLIINVYFCCFSKYKHYWTDSYQGNYWILPFWVRSPAKQLPIDLQELEWAIQPKKNVRENQQIEYLELQRKESDI